MLAEKYAGKKVCILAKDGFEQCQLLECRTALLNIGTQVHIVSLEPGRILSWDQGQWGIEIEVDKTIDDARPNDYDALIIPGGHFNPGVMLHNQQALNFVKGFFDPRQPKAVAAIREGTSMLIQAGVLKGRTIASSINDISHLQDSNTKILDQDIVIDNGLLTTRSADKLSIINQSLIEEIHHSQIH